MSYGHSDDCMCQDCIDARFEKARIGGNMNQPKGHKQNCKCVVCKGIRHKGVKETHTLKEFYEKKRNGRLSIFGTVISGYMAFWEWLGGEPTNLISNFVIDIFKVHFSDGYALILCSPLVLAWWVICSAILLTFICVCFFTFLVIGILYLLLSIYSILFELPASVINGDLDKVDEKMVGKWK